MLHRDTGDACVPVSPVSLCNTVSPVSLCNNMLQVIQRTLPSGAGQRHRALFQLARELKAIPEMADAPWDKLKTVVRQWHELALPEIRTKPFDDSWFEFVESWKAIRWAANQGPFEDILAKAVATTPPVALKYENPQIRLLVSLCCELPSAAVGQSF